MTTNIAPTRPTSFPGRPTQASRYHRSVQTPQGGPCCSLKARPAPHPAPAPSWEELLGQR